jgi:hypothetical protein
MKTNLLKLTVVIVLMAVSTNMKAFTAVLSGAWSNAATWGGVGPGANVSNNDIIIPSGLTVDLDIDVTFSGLLNSFTVDGTLNSATNHNATITLGAVTGTGNINIHRLSLSGVLTTMTFSGNMNLHVLQNQGAVINFAATASLSDSLDLDGGSLILGTGSNVTMLNSSAVRVNNGTLSTSGGVFTTGSPYDVWYVGTSKTTGLEVNSTMLRHLHLNMNSNTEVVTQGINNLVVNGDMNMAMGQFSLNGNHLTLKGDLMITTGAMFVSTATSDLTIQGTGAMTNGLVFSSGSSVNDFEIDRAGAGNVDLRSELGIAGTIHLTNGTFSLQNGALLTMLSGSDAQIGDGYFVQNGGTFNGNAMYDVEYIGGSQTSGIELTGSGLDDVKLALTSGSSAVELGDNVTINGNLNLMSGMLSLYGYDLTLDSSFSQSPSAVIVGDSTSDLTLNLVTTSTDTIYFGSINHIRNLSLNTTSGNELLIATDLTIHNQLNMMSGMIEITNANLMFRSAAFITGYSDTKYIITSGTGQVQMNVNSNSTYVTFPIGTSTTYSPAQIQQTSSGSSGMFKVRAMNNVYSQGTTGFDESNTESVVDKTWEIDAASGVVVNMNLKLGWKASDEVNGFNRNQAYITHYMSSWDTQPATVAVSGANNTYEITRMGITSLSPFAVIDTAAALSTEDITMETAIGIYPNPSVDFVTVETGAGHGNYQYELYDAAGKVVYSVSNSEPVNRIDLSGFDNGLYFIRITDNKTNASITKQVVKE